VNNRPEVDSVYDFLYWNAKVSIAFKKGFEGRPHLLLEMGTISIVHKTMLLEPLLEIRVLKEIL
jgi:hypothetical protein